MEREKSVGHEESKTEKSVRPICTECGSSKYHEHDNWCDDEHADGLENCFPFYCDECGEGFDEE